MVSGPDVAGNLAAAATLIAQAATAGAALVALPENFALMPRCDADRLAAAEDEGHGPIQDFLAAQARRHRIWLVGGTLPLKAAHAGKVRAACLVYDAAGERVARYDKMHLFDVTLANGETYRESSAIEAGAQTVVIDSPVGRLGLAVCYDLRFPELFRAMLAQGVEVFAVPSAFTATTGRAHWEVLVRARAIENLAYVIAPDQGGMHANGRATHGDSAIVGPWGEVLGRLAAGAGVVVADIEPERQAALRRGLPSIEHRRIFA